MEIARLGFGLLCLTVVSSSASSKGLAIRVYKSNSEPKGTIQFDQQDEESVGTSYNPHITHVTRSKRSADPWRSPRQYQFVTRGGDRLARYYRDERYDYDRNRPEPPRPPKRIIYYATLPEVTRRPDDRPYNAQYDRPVDRPYERPYERPYDRPHDDYNRIRDYRDYRGYDRYRGYRDYQYYDYPSRYNSQNYYDTPSYPGYPPLRDNDIVTRVQSSVIDVTSKDRDPGLSKFTIIDVEPPYLKDSQLNTKGHYFRPQASYFDSPDSNYDTRKPPRKETRLPLPPAPLTVYKRPDDKRTPRPLDVRPLDVRPLDLIITRQPPTPSSPISTQSVSPSTSTRRPFTASSPTLSSLHKYERSFKY